MLVKTILNTIEKFKSFVYEKTYWEQQSDGKVLIVKLSTRKNSQGECCECGTRCPTYDTDSYHPSLFDLEDDVFSASENIKKHLISEGLTPGTTEFNRLMTEMFNSDVLSAHFIHKPGKATLHLLKASIPSQHVKDDPYNGWSVFHKDTIHVHSIMGEHNELFSPSCIEPVAAAISKILSHPSKEIQM